MAPCYQQEEWTLVPRKKRSQEMGERGPLAPTSEPPNSGKEVC